METNNYKVYIHINKTNNKRYIGITRQNPNRRWRNGEGYIRNKYFYRSIQKYGWDNFEHEIVLCNLTKEQAEIFEIEMIKYYKTTDPKFGYNIENGGNSTGRISEETRKKMSIAKKGKYCGKNNPNYGKKMSEEQKQKISETRKKLGLGKGKNNPRYGSTFSHSKETKQKISKSLSGKNNPMYGRKGKDSPYHREIICLNDLKVYVSAREASIELNLFSSLITRVCKGKQPQTGGYKFMYLEDYNNLNMNINNN